MDNVIVGQKGTYDSFYDFLSPLVYCPKVDAVLITRYFIIHETLEEHVVNNVIVALNHESIHEAVCKLIGEKESRDFDEVPDFNDAIQKWSGWHYVIESAKNAKML